MKRCDDRDSASLGRTALAILAFIVLLSSCGGGDHGDIEAPALNVSLDLSAGALLTEPIQVNVLVDDPEQVTEVRYSIDGRPLSHRRQDVLSVTLDPLFLSSDVRDLSVRVTDADGRTAEVSTDFAVQHPLHAPKRPDTNTTCIAPVRPAAPSGSAELPNAFPNLAFLDVRDLSGIIQIPGRNDFWYVLARDGRIMRLRNDPGATEMLPSLDIRDRVVLDGEGGLLGAAFHPRFPEDGRLFVFYSGAGSPLTSYLASFVSHDGGLTFEPASEQRLIEIPLDTVIHLGGKTAFGPDGFLYLGLGDGGPGGDPFGRAQDVHDLRGSMLRIDVDSGLPYAIPPDNPFAAGGGRPEIYAWGFRNPWQWSFDRESGELWVGDVGEVSWEEVNRVSLGGNYGWPVLEGPDCYPPALGTCDSSGLIGPVWAYGRDDGVAIIGGYVYRGTRYPQLVGSYIYGDYFNKLWALEFDVEGKPAPRLLLDRGLGGVGRQNLHALAEDQYGELYYVTRQSIHKFVLQSDSTHESEPPFPATLTQTGCVVPGDPTKPAPGVIPYEINVPFWSDGAEKERWLALPPNTVIRERPDGYWELPVGSVVLKHFRFGSRWVETRMLVRHEDGEWAGYSYEWNEDQSDAELLPGSKRIDIAGQTHWFPSRSDCLACHGTATGRVLGLETRQLNRAIEAPPGVERFHQLTVLKEWGLLDNLAEEAPIWLPTLPSTNDPTEPLAHRAAAYLHSNCAYCHLPGGAGRGLVDLRYNESELVDGLGCDVRPQEAGLGLLDPRIVKPGDPEGSTLYLRLKRAGAGAMPPLGRDFVDTEGVGLINAMIESLTDCP